MKFWHDHKAAALGFLVAVAYWPGILSGGFVARWAAIGIGVPLVSSLDPRSVPESIRWLLVFLVGLGAVSLLGSPYPQAGTQDLLFIVFLCLAFVMAAQLETLDGIMTGIGWGLAASSVLSAGQWMNWWNPVPQVVSPAGLFFNREVLGEFAALVFVWAVLRPRYALAFIAAVPLALTMSRVGLLAAVVAMIYAARPTWRVLAIIIVVAAIAAIGSLLFFGFDKILSAQHRIFVWGATALNLSVLGKGLGWFSAALPFEEFAHSDALQALAELGLAGGLLIIIPIRAFMGTRGNNAERALFVAVCVETIVSFPLHFPASGFVAAVVAGYLLGLGPVVRMGDHHRRNQDGWRGFWGHAAYDGITERCGCLSAAIPVRSVSAKLETLHARTDC